MMQHNLEEQTWSGEYYFRSCGTGCNIGPSLTALCNDFEESLQKLAPTKKTILSWIARMTGSVMNHNHGNSRQPRSTKTNENIDHVFDKVLQSPKKSMLCFSKELGTERTSPCHIVKELGSHSCLIQVLQKLSPPDFQLQSQWTCVSFMKINISLTIDASQMNVMYSSVEIVNKQNMHFLDWEKSD